MTPTEPQDKNLRKYLRSILKYRETFEEAYDHILSALEKEDGTTNFQESVRKVINEGFGSPNGLVEMEEAYHKFTVKEAKKQQIANLKSYFKGSAVIIPLVLFASVYVAVTTFNLTLGILLWTLLAVNFTSWVSILIRFYYTGFYTNDTKRSIKDKVFNDIALRPMGVINMLFIVSYMGKNEAKISAMMVTYPGILSLIFMVMILYTTSFLKMNQQEIDDYKAKEQ